MILEHSWLLFVILVAIATRVSPSIDYNEQNKVIIKANKGA